MNYFLERLLMLALLEFLGACVMQRILIVVTSLKVEAIDASFFGLHLERKVSIYLI